MFKIQWRGPNRFTRFGVISQTITGLSMYTAERAEHQKSIWSRLFPSNTYYVVPA